jgi:hypothetical protein
MPRSKRPQAKRAVEPHYRWHRATIQVGDEPARTVEGPASFVEYGVDRAAVASQRAAVLAKRFTALAAELSDQSLDTHRRHALVRDVDAAWRALCFAPVDDVTWTAMAFVDAIDEAEACMSDSEVKAAVARTIAEFPLGEDDLTALHRAGNASRLEAAARADPELVPMWATYEHWRAPQHAERLFSATHPALAAKISTRDYWNALQAWRRTAGRPAKGTPVGPDKWTTLADILKRVALWGAGAEQLRDVWRRWEREGLRTPLFLREAGLHAAARDDEAPHRRRNPTTKRTGDAPRADRRRR